LTAMSTRSLDSVDSVDGQSDMLDDEDEELLLAQEEWDESIAQLQLIVSVVAMPFLGKWLGRRASQWAYLRYLKLGLTRSFFIGGL